jgi:hypothetical protein
MLRRLGCILIVLGYWTFTVFLLRCLSPVYFDGAGPMPSFYWGRVPTPDLAEYHRHQSHYDSFYDQPYRISAAGIAVMGVVLPSLLLRRTARALRALPRSSALSALLLTFAAVVSDIGTIHQHRSGPLFLLHGQFDPAGWPR